MFSLYLKGNEANAHTDMVSLLCPLIHMNLFEVNTFESKVFRDPFIAIVKYPYDVIIFLLILIITCHFDARM